MQCSCAAAVAAAAVVFLLVPRLEMFHQLVLKARYQLRVMQCSLISAMAYTLFLLLLLLFLLRVPQLEMFHQLVLNVRHMHSHNLVHR
jgi:hypothetical protein